MVKLVKGRKIKTFPSESIPEYQNDQIQKPMQENHFRGLYLSNEPWMKKIGLKMDFWERFKNRAFSHPLMYYK